MKHYLFPISLVSLFAIGAIACSSAPGRTDDAHGTQMIKASADPFEEAERWLAEILEPAAGAQASEDPVVTLVRQWRAPHVARLYRVDDQAYVAVVAEVREPAEEPAITLTLRRSSGGDWMVQDAEVAKPRPLWPTL